MSERVYDTLIVELGDKIVGLSLLQAKSLTDYLNDVHGIHPVATSVVQAASASSASVSAAPVEKTEFDVVLTGFGDNKIAVIKVVRAVTGLGLKEAKDLVESLPKPIKSSISREEADKLKAEITQSGGVCEIK